MLFKGFKDPSRHKKKTGYPLPPSRQLLSIWVVDVWEKIPETLVKKAFKVCGGYVDREVPNAANLAIMEVVVREELGEQGVQWLNDPELQAWAAELGPDGLFPAVVEDPVVTTAV